MGLAKSVEAQYFDDVVPRLFKRKVQLWVTSKCNYKCSFCLLKKRGILNNDSYPNCISKEVIDHLFKILDKRNDVVVISGGECTLYMEMLQYICDKCREHNKISIIYSNGWWGNNEYIIEKFINEISPNYIALSFNNEMNLKSIENILERFKDKSIKTRIYFNMLIGHYVKKGEVPDIFYKVGYTNILSENSPRDLPVMCNMDGIRVMPDGTVEAYCNADCNKNICKFGKITDYNSVNEIMKLKPTKGSCIMRKQQYGWFMLGICHLILGARYISLVTGTIWLLIQKIKHIFIRK